MALENSTSSNNNDASSVQGNHNHGPNKASIHPNIYQQMGNHAPFLLNPHAIAQAATAALTAAAQQVAQQQQATNSHNGSVANSPFPSNGHSNAHGGSVSLMTQNNTENENSVNNTLPTNQQGVTHQNHSTTSQTNNKVTTGIIPAPSMPDAIAPVLANGPAAPQAFTGNLQQISLNPQTAALLASNGLNPALLLNAANLQAHTNHNSTMAAAQAFVQLLQQQQQPQQQQTQQVQQVQQPQQQQAQQQPQLGQSQQQQVQQPQQQTTQGMVSNAPSHFQEQPQHNSTHNNVSTPDATKTSNTNPMIQHYNHSTTNQTSLLTGRNPQPIKKMTNSNDSLPSSLLSYGANQEKRAPKETLNVPSMLAAANTPVSQPPPQPQPQTGNVNSLYAAASNNPMFFAQMQSWKLEQLEAYTHLLRETNQPVPQPVTLLLTEARRREDKRTAKRVANRKSACTSRARKKAFVEEMTRTNARLRRQAVILSLLPDLVMAIKLNGEISFCSAQVGRVLRQDVDNLVGLSINEILVPSSRKELKRLIDKLVEAEKVALDENKEADESGRSSNSGNNSSAAVVSEQSDQGFPPLSVVKVNSCSNVSRDRQHRDDVTGALVTPNNAGARLSSLQHKPDKKKESDDVARLSSKPSDGVGAQISSLPHGQDDKKPSKMNSANFESQEDVSSSTSSDSLFNGVEDKRKNSRGNENVSDDSGYRQSVESESREDSSSTTDTSNGARPRPLAPTCNICLIRDDLSTIWCEVTSSIRTRSLKEESVDAMVASGSTSSDKRKGNSANVSNGSETSEDEQVKELLLCLRPIRDGKRVENKMDFQPVKKEQESLGESDAVLNKKNIPNKIRPMKKRPLPQPDLKKCKKAMVVKSESEAEKSVVESLIFMSSHKG